MTKVRAVYLGIHVIFTLIAFASSVGTLRALEACRPCNTQTILEASR